MNDLHAIKILDPQLTQNPAIVTRFVNEARAAARLRHRNLVRVHNIERLPGDGSWFMVLDYLEGSTLARFMAGQRAPMSPPAIVHILAQVANCIQHVHDHKIVHRDLKPDNIFLIQHGEDPHFPVVLDLGVAQLSEDLASGPATKTGTVIGTPIYMAPEQLRGERVSPAADIFALGIIAYEMSTGGFFPYQYDESRAAYFELAPTEIYDRQRSGPPVDPRRRCPELDDAWVRALRAALAPDPRARPPSAGAFARMLASAVPASQGDGAAILHQVARELIQPRLSDAELLPARELPRDAGAEALPGMDHPSRELTAEAPPVSTLAEAASQSVETSRTRRRWAMIAAAGLTALLAGGATAFTITQLLAPAGTARSAAAPSQSGTAAARPPAVAMAPRVVSAAPPASTTGEPRAGAGSALPADSVRSADDAAHVTAPPPADPPSPATPAATESSRPAAEPMHDTAQPAADPARATASPGRAHVAQPVADPSRSKPPSAADNARPAPIPAEPARSGEPLRSPAGMPGSPSGATRPSSGSATAAVRKGELAIIVRPWALIWLNGKSLGQTPYRETIPAGRYRLRIANDDAGKDETTLVTVTPDQTTTIQRSW